MTTQSEVYAVALQEQLSSVPDKARLVIDDPDGMGTRFIPVGRMCNEAAAELRRLHEESLEDARIIGMSAERELRLRAINAQLMKALCCVRDMVGHPDNLAFIDAAIAAAKEQA